MSQSILILESEISIRDILEESLRSEGYEVFSACNPQQAREFLSLPAVYCCVIWDTWSFRDVMSSHPLLAQTPVIAMSSSNRHERKYPFKPRALLKMPFDLKDFLNVVKDCCDSND